MSSRVDVWQKPSNAALRKVLNVHAARTSVSVRRKELILPSSIGARLVQAGECRLRDFRRGPNTPADLFRGADRLGARTVAIRHPRESVSRTVSSPSNISPRRNSERSVKWPASFQLYRA
jgi:hypothetical protein